MIKYIVNTIEFIERRAMDTRTLKLARNILIISGIVGGFVIWLFVPETIRNSSIFHVGDGLNGSKYGMLLALPLPLFALLFRSNPLEFHGTDESCAAMEQEKSDRNQMICGIATALGLSITVIFIMIIGLTL